MILREKTDIRKVFEEGEKNFPNYIKFCVDRKRKVVSVDREMHIEMEYELYDDGSNFSDIFGGNIVFDNLDSMEIYIKWEAHANIEQNRLLGIGQGRELTNLKIIDELTEILNMWIY